MKYKITHTTNYAYAEPVAVCHKQVLLTPRSDGRCVCHTHRLSIRPTPVTSARRIDFFGNHVHAFSIEESHRQLSIKATSRVTIQPAADIDPESSAGWEQVVAAVAEQSCPDWLEAWPVLGDSPRVQRADPFASYALTSFPPGRPICAGVLALTARIFQDFEYNKEATTVDTSTTHAFSERRGVCQDFAHVQIACLRSLGIPARYVSGYLRTIPAEGRPRLVGADQSHAWVSVYCGEVGWMEVDPTNNQLVSLDHVPLAYGRDYQDVAPIRGVFLGGGPHKGVGGCGVYRHCRRFEWRYTK